MKRFLKSSLATLFFVLPTLSYAAAQPTHWQIDPAASSVSFTAIQNDAPVTGSFKNFSGEINFDPNKLNESNIKITIDMNSVTTSYQELQDTLKTADWFNVKLFPKAVFKADHFSKLGENKYLANGTLTVRDKSAPLSLTFELDEYTDTKAHAQGDTSLKRNIFGVGQGDWAKTNEVKDEVQIKFSVAAKPLA